MAASISGNAGRAGVIVTWNNGTITGIATADSQGNYLSSPLPPGAYTLQPSLAGWAFNPAQQTVIVATVNIVGVNFQPVSTSTPASGFDTSFIAQNSAGLNVWVSAGQYAGVNVPSQAVAVPVVPAQTYIWVDKNGNVLTGAELPPSIHPVALVTVGELQTSGSGPNAPNGYVVSPAVISIQDLRS